MPVYKNYVDCHGRQQRNYLNGESQPKYAIGKWVGDELWMISNYSLTNYSRDIVYVFPNPPTWVMDKDNFMININKLSSPIELCARTDHFYRNSYTFRLKC